MTVIEHGGVPPEAPAPVGPPPRSLLRKELRFVRQYPRLVARAPRLLRAPRGSGPVVDIPGWKTPPSAMLPLRSYLRFLGYDARSWGLGWNQGRPHRDIARLIPTVERRARLAGRPLVLIGWSLGGVIAREVARRAPHAVRRVICYGSPIIGGPSYTATARRFDPAFLSRALEETLENERRRPIRVPVTSIYSREDGVVSWPACIDRYTPDVDHVEVRSTHIGMGLDPDVWLAIAERLAR